MPFGDLREFIARCEQLGQVQRIEEEVDWNLEIGAITRRCCQLSAPAPFFQRIKGYPKGYQLLGGPLATYKRLAIALDLKPDAPYREILAAYEERKGKKIKPRLVKDGPCKENIHLGDDVDLFEFPVPLIHGGDGGRYIGTWHITATRDPDSGWMNWGMYRLMVHTKNTMGGLLVPQQHIGIMFKKYEFRNKPMEFAVATGTEPITSFVGASPVPLGVDEVDVVGGIRGEPLDVVKCETVDLEVPATSEVVIEGEVLPNVREPEGPFGEYPGYRSSPRIPRPLYKVKAITHRNDPILTMCCTGIPMDDDHIIFSVTWTSDIHDALKAAGFPVTAVYVPPEYASTVCVVATKTHYNNIASRIAGCIWATIPGAFGLKVIVVDDDVDPTNLHEVWHAWATKSHPVRGATVIANAPINSLVPMYSPEEQSNEWGANVCYDCTWPRRWPKDAKPVRSSFNDIYPEEVRAKVLRNWTKYGFRTLP